MFSRVSKLFSPARQLVRNITTQSQTNVRSNAKQRRAIVAAAALAATGATAYFIVQYTDILSAGSTDQNSRIQWRKELDDKDQVLVMNENSVWRELLGELADTLPVFSPEFMLRNRHFQTIANVLYRAVDDEYRNLVAEREVYSMQKKVSEKTDTSVCYIDWFVPKSKQSNHEKATIFLLPGVFSGTEGVGVKHFVLFAVKRGYKVAVLNYIDEDRTDHKSKSVIPGVTHDTEDLVTLVKHVRDKTSGSPLIGMGISLGANILTQMLGELGKSGAHKDGNDLLDAAVALANPFDLRIATEAIRASVFRSHFYDKNLIRKRKLIMAENLARLHMHFHSTEMSAEYLREQLKALEDIQSTRDLDANFTLRWVQTARMNPNLSLEEFYAEQSSAPVFDYVRVPLITIQAYDDPISLVEAWPTPSQVKQNPRCCFLTTRYGGHIGYLSDRNFGKDMSPNWSEVVILDMLDRVVDQNRRMGKLE